MDETPTGTGPGSKSAPDEDLTGQHDKPVVLITGGAGNLGTAIVDTLAATYRVVVLDRDETDTGDASFTADLTSEESIATAMEAFRRRFGNSIAAVLHLAAFFDFSGEPNPLYEKLNVTGTKLLLKRLQDFEVERFVYTSTMLVHAPTQPGERIDETSPIGPRWEYPKSKAVAEEAVVECHGRIPYAILRLAGAYDDGTAVPTLSHQIARIYERDFKSHVYAGDLSAGQTMIHMEDLCDLVRRVVDRRGQLPDDLALVAGEPDAMGYQALQDRIGELIHGEREWRTLEMPKTLAAAGAWAEEKAEPIIPDEFDRGEKPFIRPFMIAMADDHYALDISKARRLTGWQPKHRLHDGLARIVAALKDDPMAWYRDNGIMPPSWLESVEGRVEDADALRRDHEATYRRTHRENLWAHFLNIGFGSWLVTSPPILGYESTWLAASDIASGVGIVVFGFLALSWRFGWARWVNAAIGCWLLFAPLVFWAPTAAGYLNDTLVGMLVIGFAVLVRPPPGVAPHAAAIGPIIPPGWDFTPSSWTQRMPIIALAFVGLYVSRYLAAYQLGHIGGVWEPFFAGGPDPKNGTEEIITSSVSEAWPVPDAGLGGLTYMLEILTGIIGSSRRWRTMPWLVTAFGIMIVPLGIVSITFIIIQPIVIGTWCTLCLIAAAAMLLQIPYSLDELVATGQFLLRRQKAGRPILRVFLFGDTDEGEARPQPDEFDQPPGRLIVDVVGGGVSISWNLALCALIGVSLMLTRLTLGSEGGMADADHLIGALVVTTSVIAFAEIARAARFLNMAFGAALCVTPFIFDVDSAATVASIAAGLALIVLSIRRGTVRRRYGDWQRFVV